MPRNVEIKARVRDLEVVKQRIIKLKSAYLVDNDDDDNYKVDSMVIKQVDSFYNLPTGRPGKLKLRKVEVGNPVKYYRCI